MRSLYFLVLHYKEECFQVLQMEQFIIKTLDFNLSTPTAFTFLVSYLNSSRADQRCQDLAKVSLNCFFVFWRSTNLSFFQYLSDLALMEFSFLTYLPSTIAAACTFLAHYVTDGMHVTGVRRSYISYLWITGYDSGFFRFSQATFETFLATN